MIGWVSSCGGHRLLKQTHDACKCKSPHGMRLLCVGVCVYIYIYLSLSVDWKRVCTSKAPPESAQDGGLTRS